MKRLVILACGAALLAAAPALSFPVLAQSFSDISAMPGWVMNNNSTYPITDWSQGIPDVFPAQSGAPDSYISANYNNTLFGTISNWLITPELTLENGQIASFFTRTVAESEYPDRLQVRMSTAGASTNVGTLPSDVGTFTTLLLDVNPALAEGGYPEAWTRYDLTLTGLGAPVSGRLAFRYFVTAAGPYACNANYIGIDTFSLETPGQTVPEPATCLLLGMGLVAFAAKSRRRS